MDLTASDTRMRVISADKVLQRELSTLSKSMPSCMVQQISDCLRSSHHLTDFEVQVICSGATDTQKATRLLQTLLHKGRMACLRFFQCLNACNPALFRTISKGLVKVTDEAHRHVEKSSCSEATVTVPPCIININNSSLNNCIIGNNNSLCCLLSQTNINNDPVEQLERDYPHSETSESTEANVQVNSSNVEYVIIGDNNYMNIESSLDSEELQEETDSVQEDSEE